MTGNCGFAFIATIEQTDRIAGLYLVADLFLLQVTHRVIDRIFGLRPSAANGANSQTDSDKRSVPGGGKNDSAGGHQDSAAVLPTLSLVKGRLSTNLYVPGELIAFQQVDLYAKVNSFVKKLYVDVG